MSLWTWYLQQMYHSRCLSCIFLSALHEGRVLSNSARDGVCMLTICCAFPDSWLPSQRDKTLIPRQAHLEWLSQAQRNNNLLTLSLRSFDA